MSDPWEEQERNEQQWAYEDALREENAKLQDENARLRSCLSDDKENARLVFGEYHLLVEENAKLRAERDYLLVNSNPTAAELRRVRSAWKNDRDENEKLRELCNDMWSVMSCEYASDAMADACHDVLDCDMDDLEGRVNELCKEES